MQRYRVNLPLLIGLVVGTIVLAGGSYGLYYFQKERNANRLLVREEAARAEGDLQESVNLLITYLKVRPRDQEAMARLSETLADIAEDPTSEPRDLRNAIGQLEATVREYPDREDLRRRLVDLYMSRRVGMLKQALDHVSQLLNQNPGDPELEVMRSKCYFAAADSNALDHGFKLIGYDKLSDTFDASAAVAPNDPGVYSRVAMALRNDEYNEELAERVIDQMIEANPTSGEAYLALGQYYELTDRKEDAVPEIKKALEFAPTDPSIVVANARLRARDEDFESAAELLKTAIDENPDNPGLYQTMAEVVIRQGDYEGALEWCDKGIASVPIERSQLLMLQKARLQLQTQEYDAARATIEQMRSQEMMPSAYPDYLEARLLMADNKWFEAAKMFEKYQAFMANFPSLGVELNVMLGLCREKLGQQELALDAFNQALQLEPENSMADLGRQRMLARIGGGRATGGGGGNSGVSIYAALGSELAKSPEDQDWEAFDKTCEEYIERMQLSKGMLLVLRGEVFMRRGMYAEARAKLIEAYKEDPENLGVRRAAVKLFAADPEQGPAKALSLLDKVVADFGDLPILRLERADLLSSINDEDLTEQLFALTEGLDGWTTDQKVQLWKGLAEKFGRLRNSEAQSECLKQVVELEPGDLPTLLDLFQSAVAANDTAAMSDAQDRILDVVGSKENPTWLYTQASREIAEWRAAGGEGDGLDKADELIERAIAQRGEWHALYNLKGDIALARRDVRGALASYDRASELGKQDARTLYQYIKLLMARGRFADAVERMETINRGGRVRLLGRDYAEALLRTGKTADSIVAAQEVIQEAPNNASLQLWMGRFLTRASAQPGIEDSRKQALVASAGEAFKKAVELDANLAEAWVALVGHYRSIGKVVQADDTVRQAEIALVEDQNLLLFATCYELVGRTIDAEALYTLAMEQAADADRSRVARRFAQFYLGQSYQRPDGIAKATPLLNQILRDANEEVIPADGANARWARSTAARLLARSGAYQDLLNAERLIASNSDNGDLSVQDRLLMAEILAPRPEPVSRLKAANLLEDLGQNLRLTKKSELDLARLYFALGEWRKCREQMLDIIGRYPDDRDVRLSYLQMLLQRGGPAEIDLAVRQVQRLQEIAPNDFNTREMLARVAFEKGRKEQAARALTQMLPRNLGDLTAEQIPLVIRVAQQLVAFDAVDSARKLFEAAARAGGVKERFALAQFISEHVDGQQGLDELENLRDDLRPEQMVQGGLLALRAVERSSDEPLPDALITRVQGWLERGLRENPDQIALLLHQAEMQDLRREYDKAADSYRKLLDREDLRGTSRAIVLNNLAYLLALSTDDKASISEADRYVAEAVDLLGPGAEILDTRAVVSIANGQYADAVEDLKLAVIDRPTASKYFHLAVALSKAGRTDQASESWKEALDRGLTRESVTRLEREQFDEIQQKLGQAAGGGLTSTAG